MFHFKNHIGYYCIDNFDPNKIPELNNFNTEICEQLFRSVNAHKNCKSMNEARFFLFWFYQMELHNMDIQGLASVLPNLHCDFWWREIKITEVELKNLPDPAIDNLSEDLWHVQICSIPVLSVLQASTQNPNCPNT